PRRAPGGGLAAAVPGAGRGRPPRPPADRRLLLQPLPLPGPRLADAQYGWLPRGVLSGDALAGPGPLRDGPRRPPGALPRLPPRRRLDALRPRAVLRRRAPRLRLRLRGPERRAPRGLSGLRRRHPD